MTGVNIYQSEYPIKSIYRVLRATHKPGVYDNTTVGRHSDCFVYVLKGKISYIYDDYMFTVYAGDTAYLPKDGRYMMRVFENDEFIFVDFDFECDLLRSGFGIKFNHGKEYFDKLWIVWQKSSVACMSESKSLLYKIYADILYCFDKSEYIRRSLKKKIEKSVEEIIQNYTDSELSIDSIINNSKISASQYRSLFRKIYNMSPKQYVLKLRIDYAKELLIQTSNNIADISLACGFTDEFYFSALFKKKCGCSPSEYRKLHMNMRKDIKRRN